MKKRVTSAAAATAALACLLTSPLALRAQKRMSEWEAQVRLKLAGAALLVSLVDARTAFDPYIGRLEEDTHKDILFTLHKGVKYMFIGVCDSDCRNLGMKMYDDDGDFIGQNSGSTATPDLEIIPERTQDFTVRVTMKRCNDDTCYYGIGVYSM